MKKNRSLFKTILIFTLIMGLLSLVVMLFVNIRKVNDDATISINTDTMKLVQLDEIQDGAPTAIVDTTLGEVRFVLYPQYSPNAVENFTSLAKSGYYDGTYVYDSQKGAYSGLGAKDKKGNVGDKANEHVKRELNQDLWSFRGAVCMLNTAREQTFKQKIFGGGTYFCGSRFLLLNSIKFDDEMCRQMRDSSESSELAEAFIKKGGIPNFSQQMTIIGQTYSGYDVVDALASLEATEHSGLMTPNQDVIINSVKISTFSDEDRELYNKEEKNK